MAIMVFAAGGQAPLVIQVADAPFDTFYPGVSGAFALLHGRKISSYDSNGRLSWERQFNKKVKDALVLDDGSVAVIFDDKLVVISPDGGSERMVGVNDEAVTLVSAPESIIIAGHAYGAQAFHKDTLSTIWDYYPHDECDY